jgi:hypothetical protein
MEKIPQMPFSTSPIDIARAAVGTRMMQTSTPMIAFRYRELIASSILCP